MSEIKLTYIDDPKLAEAFADSPEVKGWSRDGVMHLEFRSVRLDMPRATEAQSGEHIPVSRVAMTLPVAIALQATLSHHLAELEKQGVVKRMDALPTEAKH